MTQDDIINFDRIPPRIKGILPITARWLEVWENTHKQEPRHWRVHPTCYVKPGLMQVVVTLICCIHTNRKRSEKLKLFLPY